MCSPAVEVEVGELSTVKKQLRFDFRAEATSEAPSLGKEDD